MSYGCKLLRVLHWDFSKWPAEFDVFIKVWRRLSGRWKVWTERRWAVRVLERAGRTGARIYWRLISRCWWQAKLGGATDWKQGSRYGLQVIYQPWLGPSDTRDNFWCVCVCKFRGEYKTFLNKMDLMHQTGFSLWNTIMLELTNKGERELATWELESKLREFLNTWELDRRSCIHAWVHTEAKG